MITRLLTAVAFMAALTVSAAAGTCPLLVKEIDAAMQTAQLSDDDKAKVMELRNEGEAQHKAGEHAKSVETLNEAKKMLGM